MTDIRELPLTLLKQFGVGGIVGGEIPHYITPKRVFTSAGEGGTFLVVDDGDYPELERRFLLFGGKGDYEQGDERPYLEIHVLGRELEHDKDKGDLYQDRVEFSGIPSGVFSHVCNPIIDLSCRILIYSVQLMKSPGFKAPMYRVKHRANYPTIVWHE